MGKIVIRCNHKQLEDINKDFEDANVNAEVCYGIFHKGTTNVEISYDDAEKGYRYIYSYKKVKKYSGGLY